MDANKATDAEYFPKAVTLFASMVAKGFDPEAKPEGPVPIDPNGELLGGAHRVACALALRIESIVALNDQRLVFAPPWGEQWFITHGCPAEDLERIRRDWLVMSDQGLNAA